jgi:hypothetical protein
VPRLGSAGSILFEPIDHDHAAIVAQSGPRALPAGFPPTAAAAAYGLACAARRKSGREQRLGATSMKVLLWIVAIIFLIGLAVVFGLGKLIF